MNRLEKSEMSFGEGGWGDRWIGQEWMLCGEVMILARATSQQVNGLFLSNYFLSNYLSCPLFFRRLSRLKVPPDFFFVEYAQKSLDLVDRPLLVASLQSEAEIGRYICAPSINCAQHKAWLSEILKNSPFPPPLAQF